MSVRTTMPILVLDEFPTFTITRLSITLPIFSKCRGMAYTNPNAKVRKIFEILTIMRGAQGLSGDYE